jgi:SPP1 family predicted phage head-tail adaptor
MTIEAGKLWHEISIEQRGDTRDAHGASIASWSEYLATYAELVNLSGNELIQAQQINSRINTKFIIRWDAGIRATMRILFKSRYYGIVYTNNIDERDKVMHLLCERLEDVTNG